MKFHTDSDPSNTPLGRFLLNPTGFFDAITTSAWAWITTVGPTAGPLVALAAAMLAAVRSWWFRRCQNALHHNARVVTVMVPPDVDPHGAHTLWSNLTGLNRPWWRRLVSGQPHLSFEYLFDHDEVSIRIWVPGTVPPKVVENAVEAAWPAARTQTSLATPPIQSAVEPGRHRLATGGTLRLARPEALPIRTDFPVDPLRALFGAPAGMGLHDQACVQILARPATGRRVNRARRSARHLHAGRSVHVAGRLLDLVTPGAMRPRSGQPAQHPQAVLEHRTENTAIVGNERGSQWDTIIRYVVTTTIPHGAGKASRRRAHDELRGRAHAVASAMSVYTDHNYYERHRLGRPVESLARRRFRTGDLMAVPALAALAHLPTDEAVPGVQRAGARAVAPPPRIPIQGPLIKPIGVADTGHARPVGLQVSDARHHLWVVGPTGTGKSTFLAQMVLHDAEHGRGAVVIDPKGDLVSDILMRLPEHVADKVVLFDADSHTRVPCLNPLEGDKDAAVDNVVSVFSRVFAAAWGPRTDDILRAACLTLRAASDTPTLADIPNLLTDPAAHGRLIGAAERNPVLKNFWIWYTQLPDGHRSQVSAPLLNKLRALLLRPFVVKAIAGGPSTVDMAKVLDGGLLLCRIPKGSLGEDTARLLGALLVSRVWQATTARSRIPQRHRRDAALYIDEAHNFLHLPYSIEDLLAEARAYRLSLVLAHQNLGQLPRELKEGIAANARTKIMFSASPTDARELARHTEPRLSEHDLAHLAAFHAAVLLMVNGEQAPPFTVTTQPLTPAIRGRAKKIRHAAQRHTRPLPTGAPRPSGTPARPGNGIDPRRAA